MTASVSYRDVDMHTDMPDGGATGPTQRFGHVVWEKIKVANGLDPPP